MYVQNDILFEGLFFETHWGSEKAELMFNTPVKVAFKFYSTLHRTLP